MGKETPALEIRAPGRKVLVVLLEHARRTAAERVGNARFEQANAQVPPFEAESFDVAISRTGAMFFGDLVAAFTNISRALRPSGRLVMGTWQPLPRNEWIREIGNALGAGRAPLEPPPDAPGPFALADSDRVRNILGAAGFTDVEFDGTDADMWFGTDVDDAHRFVLGLMGWMLDGLDETGRARALESLRASMSAHDSDPGVTYQSAGWTIQATRA